MQVPQLVAWHLGGGLLYRKGETSVWPYLLCPGARPPRCSQGWASSVNNASSGQESDFSPQTVLQKSTPSLWLGTTQRPSCAQPQEDSDLGCQSSCYPVLILQTDAGQRQGEGRGSMGRGEPGGPSVSRTPEHQTPARTTWMPHLCLTVDPKRLCSWPGGCSLSNPNSILVTGAHAVRPLPSDLGCRFSTFPPSCVFSLLIESW